MPGSHFMLGPLLAKLTILDEVPSKPTCDRRPRRPDDDLTDEVAKSLVVFPRRAEVIHLLRWLDDTSGKDVGKNVLRLLEDISEQLQQYLVAIENWGFARRFDAAKAAPILLEQSERADRSWALARKAAAELRTKLDAWLGNRVTREGRDADTNAALRIAGERRAFPLL